MKSKLILEEIGFDRRDAIIYEALLAVESASPSDLVTQTGLHRPDVYKSIAVLLDKGLISTVPKGKYKHYAAESPQKVEEAFKAIEKGFFDKVEDLHKKYEQKQNKPKLIYKEGPDAIRDAFSQMIHGLKKGETYYRYSSDAALTNVRTHVPKDYKTIRDQKQLERLVITNEPTQKRHRLALGRTVKSIPKEFDLFEYGISLVIYQNKVVVADYNSNSTITIENEKFAEFQKKIFKLLFKKL